MTRCIQLKSDINQALKFIKVSALKKRLTILTDDASNLNQQRLFENFRQTLHDRGRHYSFEGWLRFIKHVISFNITTTVN